MRTVRPQSQSLPRRAFTLIEMLVVIVIIVILLAIAIPSFSSMIYSSEASIAEGLLRSALRGGKDAAMRSAGDNDAAVVFFFEPGGKTACVPCVKVGVLTDRDDADNDVAREVFVPIAGVEPVQLPRGWMVRGYVPPGGIDSDSGGTQDVLADVNAGWYEDRSDRPLDPDVGNWLFPETGFYDLRQRDEGSQRQTFMVRFEAGTGIMKTSPGQAVLVFAVRPSSEDRPAEAWKNAYRTEDPTKFVTRLLTAPRGGGGGAITDVERRALIGGSNSGTASSDMVLARPVGQLALYDEQRLATALGVRPDTATGCLYQESATGGTSGPRFVTGVTNVQRSINRWIEGDTNLNGTVQSAVGTDQPQAKIFTIERYTGALQSVEVQP